MEWMRLIRALAANTDEVATSLFLMGTAIAFISLATLGNAFLWIKFIRWVAGDGC